MKDAKGHGSNPRGAHAEGVDQIGQPLPKGEYDIRRLKNQGTYYKNEGEDSGSISAVVPSKEFLRRKS